MLRPSPGPISISGIPISVWGLGIVGAMATAADMRVVSASIAFTSVHLHTHLVSERRFCPWILRASSSWCKIRHMLNTRYRRSRIRIVSRSIPLYLHPVPQNFIS